MKTSPNHSAKHGDDGGKSKSLHEASAHAQDRNREQPAYKNQVLQMLRAYKLIEHFTTLRFPINEVFNIIKDQP